MVKLLYLNAIDFKGSVQIISVTAFVQCAHEHELAFWRTQDFTSPYL